MVTVRKLLTSAECSSLIPNGFYCQNLQGSTLRRKTHNSHNFYQDEAYIKYIQIEFLSYDCHVTDACMIVTEIKMKSCQIIWYLISQKIYFAMSLEYSLNSFV